MICDDANNFSTCLFTSDRCPCPANEPILTFSFNGFPIVVCEREVAIAFHTSSILFPGTNILRIAVHFCPAFDVISFLTSSINISHSVLPGVTSSPSTMQFNESASLLKGTDSLNIFGCDFNNKPVEAEPVKVTTS